MNVKLDFERYPCKDQDVLRWDNRLWISIIVLLLATAHLLITIKYIHDIGKRYEKLKKRYQMQYESNNAKDVEIKKGLNSAAHVSVFIKIELCRGKACMVSRRRTYCT